MAWIRQVSDEEASGTLAEIYRGGKKRAGRIANIIRVMSLRPKLLKTFMDFYLQVMQGRSALTRAERELIATVTSQVNECHY